MTDDVIEFIDHLYEYVKDEQKRAADAMYYSEHEDNRLYHRSRLNELRNLGTYLKEEKARRKQTIEEENDD